MEARVDEAPGLRPGPSKAQLAAPYHLSITSFWTSLPRLVSRRAK